MSIFGNHIQESDSILEQWYEVSSQMEFVRLDPWLDPNVSEKGHCLIPKRSAPIDIIEEGYYVDIWWAYSDWRPNRPHLMVDKYHMPLLAQVRIDKRHYFRELSKAGDKGEIKVHAYKGEYYYNLRDLCEFNSLYEIDLILKFCKKHKYHWSPLK